MIRRYYKFYTYHVWSIKVEFSANVCLHKLCVTDQSLISIQPLLKLNSRQNSSTHTHTLSYLLGSFSSKHIPRKRAAHGYRLKLDCFTLSLHKNYNLQQQQSLENCTFSRLYITYISHLYRGNLHHRPVLKTFVVIIPCGFVTRTEHTHIETQSKKGNFLCCYRLSTGWTRFDLLAAYNL